MFIVRTLGMFTSLAVLLAAAPASAGPSEPALVVEKLADPDPGFVPPPPEKPRARVLRRAEKDPTLDEAFEDLGRVAGQAAQIAEQRAEAEIRRAVESVCKSIETVRSSGIDVSAWDKDC